MKLYYVLLVLFAIGHLQELKSILKDIEHMQEQMKHLNNHIKELKNQPQHIEHFVAFAKEKEP